MSESAARLDSNAARPGCCEVSYADASGALRTHASAHASARPAVYTGAEAAADACGR